MNKIRKRILSAVLTMLICFTSVFAGVPVAEAKQVDTTVYINIREDGTDALLGSSTLVWNATNKSFFITQSSKVWAEGRGDKAYPAHMEGNVACFQYPNLIQYAGYYFTRSVKTYGGQLSVYPKGKGYSNGITAMSFGSNWRPESDPNGTKGASSAEQWRTVEVAVNVSSDGANGGTLNIYVKKLTKTVNYHQYYAGGAVVTRTYEGAACFSQLPSATDLGLSYTAVDTFVPNNGGQNITVQTNLPFNCWTTDGKSTFFYGGYAPLSCNAFGTSDIYACWNYGTGTSPAAQQGSAVTLSFNPNGGTSVPAQTHRYNFVNWTYVNASANYSTLGGNTYPGSYNYPDAFTFPSTSRTGYTLNCWVIPNVGNYTAGQQVVLGADATAIADWTPNTYTVAYDANGGNGAPDAQAFTYDTAGNLSGTIPTRTGYTFKGWARANTASSAEYSANQEVKNLAESGTVTLYAVWEANKYTATYDANGGKIALDPVIYTFSDGTKLTSIVPAKEDCIFLGWSKSKDGTNIIPAGTNISTEAGNVTYYAAWKQIEYWNLSYDTDGGIGTVKNVRVDKEAADKTVEVTSIVPVKTGCKLIHWAEYKGDKFTGKIYNAKDKITVDSDKILKAVYEKIKDPTVDTTKVEQQVAELAKKTEQLQQSINTVTNDLSDFRNWSEAQWDNLNSLIVSTTALTADQVKMLVDFIRSTDRLTDEQKSAILKELINGYLSAENRKLLESAIASSSISETDKALLKKYIDEVSSVNFEKQKELISSLNNGSSITYVAGDGTEYVITKTPDGKLTIALKNLTGKELTIPETFTLAGNSYPVTKVSDKAFVNNKTLEKVTIPSNITSIGNSAFEGCTALKTVVTTSGLTSIGNRAFYGCTSLKSFKVPNTVVTIGNSAFENCKKLSKVTLGKKLLTIGKKAFKKTAIKSITIPRATIKINASAFESCTKLTTVAFKDFAYSGLTTLGSKAFKGDKALKSIKIPKKVSTVAKQTFKGCVKLKSVGGMNKVSEISDSAFENCKALTKITLPGRVQKVKAKAFYGCKKLSKVTIKSSALTAVGKNAFKKCKKNISFSVPDKKIKAYGKLLKGKY